MISLKELKKMYVGGVAYPPSLPENTYLVSDITIEENSKFVFLQKSQIHRIFEWDFLSSYKIRKNKDLVIYHGEGEMKAIFVIVTPNKNVVRMEKLNEL